MTIDKKKHLTVYNCLKNLKLKRSISKVFLFRSKSGRIDGSAVGGKKIGGLIWFTDGFLEKYKQNPLIVDYLVGHELTHIEFNDWRNTFKKFGRDFHPFKDKRYKCAMFCILVELRADIQSAITSGLNSKEIRSAQIFIERNNNGEKWLKRPIRNEFKNGYPHRIHRIRYSRISLNLHIKGLLNRNSFEILILYPLLKEYGRQYELDATYITSLIAEVKKEFWKNCNGKFL